MKPTELITFENPILGTIRGLLDEKGEPWFLAAQVCRCLGLKDSASAVKQTEERMRIAEEYYNSVGQVSNRPLHSRKINLDNGSFGKTEVFIIPEQFLYELIFASRKQTAIAFRAWVTGDVLPSLRKHGEYRMQGKLIRRSLTDTIQSEIIDKTKSPNTKKWAYKNFTSLINKSLGLPNTVDRDSLPSEMLEKLARRENLVQSIIAEGKSYNEVKAFILANFLQ